MDIQGWNLKGNRREVEVYNKWIDESDRNLNEKILLSRLLINKIEVYFVLDDPEF